MSKKHIYLSLAFGLIVVLGAALGMKYFPRPEWRCLADGETAEPIIEDNGRSGFVTVSVLDNNQEISSFKIEDVITNSVSVETHKCGIYLMKVFNFDPKKTEQDVGYKDELWKYDYSGNGEKLILLSEKPDEYVSYYNDDFRVDPLERYIVLERFAKEEGSYLPVLVVKDLATKEDIYTLPWKKIYQEYPEMVEGFSIDILSWSNDGRYFWGKISAAAMVSAYFRIDIETWAYEMFEAPEHQGGGDQLNPDNGWVTHHTGNFWLLENMEAGSKGSRFYLYNLFTRENVLIYEAEQPDLFIIPTWLSDTEIEYELPSGEREIYTFNK